MRSPLLDTPGAVAGQAPDDMVAAHYGNPYAEQRALAEGRALVDRSNRGVVHISGPDRLSWLNSLMTQKLDTLEPGVPTEALVLDPQGRVEHHLILVDDGEAVWAHVEPETADQLVAYLDKMRFLLRVEVADRTSDYAVVSVAAPGAGPAQITLPHDAIAIGGDVLLPRVRLASAADDLGRGLAGLWAYEALRIAARLPRLRFETDDKTIPHEVAWVGTAVRLNKGCYRGQETVARVHNLGHPPRRLVFLHLDGSVDELPPHGAPVTIGTGRRPDDVPVQEQVGFVGSSARHHELGPIALAVVKRTVLVDAELLAGGVAASQEVIVPPDAGRNVRIDPALRRRLR